jgi:hypothetical protein
MTSSLYHYHRVLNQLCKAPNFGSGLWTVNGTFVSADCGSWEHPWGASIRSAYIIRTYIVLHVRSKVVLRSTSYMTG